MTFLERLRRVLPHGWFSDVDPVLATILTGSASIWDVLQAQIDDTRLQARLLTANGPWLDARVGDYLPATFQRRVNELDAAFAVRAAREVLRPRATRPALQRLLTDQGAAPFRVFEPSRPADTGGYGVGGVGYGVAGGWGSATTPYQVFVNAHRPTGSGIPNRGGYGIALGYGAGGGAWSAPADHRGGVTDAELYASIARVLPAGVTAWVNISS